MAVATVPSVGQLVPAARVVIMCRQGYKPNWVVGSTPGGQSGFIFEKYFKSPKCPHAVSAWTYFSQNTGNTEDDASLTVTCAAGRYYIYTLSTQYLHTIYTLSTDCAGSTIPAAPSGATMEHDGSTTAGSVITYTCSGGNKLYAIVSSTFRYRSVLLVMIFLVRQ